MKYIKYKIFCKCVTIQTFIKSCLHSLQTEKRKKIEIKVKKETEAEMRSRRHPAHYLSKEYQTICCFQFPFVIKTGDQIGRSECYLSPGSNSSKELHQTNEKKEDRVCELISLKKFPARYLFFTYFDFKHFSLNNSLKYIYIHNLFIYFIIHRTHISSNNELRRGTFINK